MMDLFLFPSYKEGIPLSLIEVQESKVPCFISDTICNEVIISNIVTKISLEKDSNYWTRMILNYKLPPSIKIFDNDWDINKIIKKLESLYIDSIKGE